MTIDAFIQVITELLNTPEKVGVLLLTINRNNLNNSPNIKFRHDIRICFKFLVYFND